MDKNKRATLRIIAKKANVSLTTVSYVLNGKGSIGPTTKKLIMDIAEQLHYIPNKAARALRGVHTKTIGVVINHMHNPFFIEVFKGIEHITDQKGYTYLVSQTHDDLEKEQRQLQQLAESGVDGILLLPGTDKSDHIKSIEKKYNIPIVLIANFFEDMPFFSIVADNSSGARMAARHLLSLGSRTIIHIAGPQNQTMCSYRMRAFINEIQKHDPDYVPKGKIYNIANMSTELGYEAMPRIVSEHSFPLAIFAVNDETALGVLRYCREKRIKVPEQIAVIGFSDITLISEINIALSTIRIPAEELGERATKILINVIESENLSQYERIVLPVELVIRNSTEKQLEAPLQMTVQSS